MVKLTDFDLGLDEKQAVLGEIKTKEDTGQQLAMRSANLNEVPFEPLRCAKEELEAIDNPLLRSGILLEGAARSLMTGDTGVDDGIVTAEKILGLNLHGTKTVVLSALRNVLVFGLFSERLLFS